MLITLNKTILNSNMGQNWNLTHETLLNQTPFKGQKKIFDTGKIKIS